jgi:hypothetical protein
MLPEHLDLQAAIDAFILTRQIRGCTTATVRNDERLVRTQCGAYDPPGIGTEGERRRLGSGLTAVPHVCNRLLDHGPRELD